MRNLCGVIYEKKTGNNISAAARLLGTNLTIICCLHTPQLKSQLFMWMQQNNGVPETGGKSKKLATTRRPTGRMSIYLLSHSLQGVWVTLIADSIAGTFALLIALSLVLWLGWKFRVSDTAETQAEAFKEACN